MSFDQGFERQDPQVDDHPATGSVAVMSRASSIASNYSMPGALSTHGSNSNADSILNMSLVGNQHLITDIDGNDECHLNHQQQHLTDNGKSNNDNLMQETSTTATAATNTVADDTTSTLEAMIKEQTVSITSEANDEFTSLLYKLKKSVEALSSEMSNYMSVAEGVEIDYVRVQDSLMKEKKRLNEVAPDIDGTTSSFVNF